MKNKIKALLLLISLSFLLSGCTEVSINTDIFGKGVKESADSIETQIEEDHRTLREKWLDFKYEHNINIGTTDERKHTNQESAIDKLLGLYSGKENKANYDKDSFKPYSK